MAETRLTWANWNEICEFVPKPWFIEGCFIDQDGKPTAEYADHMGPRMKTLESQEFLAIDDSFSKECWAVIEQLEKDETEQEASELSARFNSSEEVAWNPGCFKEGVAARLAGKPITASPHSDQPTLWAHKSWVAGWCDADQGEQERQP